MPDHEDRARNDARSVWGVATVLSILIACALALGWVAIRTNPHPPSERAVMNRPFQTEGDGYVTSQTCRSCHPQQYKTWHASYHRTMTTVPSAQTVISSFDDVEVIVRTGRYRLQKRGNEFWAELDDPDWDGKGARPRRIARQIVLVTGSHHQQFFWYATERGRLLGQLPLAYLVDERRWVPKRSAVMHPPGEQLMSETGHWNAVCIACHATNGRPWLDQPFGTTPVDALRVDSRVTEFGIACEACHGPSAEHVRLNANPGRRYWFHLTGQPDSTIVQPTRVDPRKSSEACGQCHSVWEWYDEKGERDENYRGVPYKPGGELRKWRFVAQPTRNMDSPTMKALLQKDPNFISDAFWSDGMVRVSGREYNGLIESPCYVRATERSTAGSPGENSERSGAGRRGPRKRSEPSGAEGSPRANKTLTCMSCHMMHKRADDPRPMKVWADDQLKLGMDGRAACLQCHESFRTNLQAHTRHEPQSTGSDCYNCHMPYTTYGLLKAIRSHQITSPDVHADVETGRPNACNSCHLDKTLRWTSDYLAKWYGIPQPELDADQQSIAASLLRLLSGDAGQRALAAYSMGWTAAQRVSGTGWMAPFLAQLLDDPYDAVRFIAYRSLRTIPGYEALEYDYAAPRDRRSGAIISALQVWRESRRPVGDPILIDPEGALKIDVVTRLQRSRNNRRVMLRE